ncbi:hypothetical protein ACNF0G_29300 (plasmid) [Pseudomonas aeruginosa]|uniref:hypothetical protein n=1 Tax=Pseudomonas aeruginosa TaxID=287 RepID=UPI003D040B4B|nr:hypothetical protein [Pseudomonas aeruginosa]
MSESNLVLSCRHLSILLRYVYPKDRLTCDLELKQIEQDGQYLREENIRSVRFSCRGLDYDEGHFIPFTFDDQAELVSAVELLKLADTYHRNSCDAPGYYQSPAYELLSRIRDAAIGDLPGFKEAPVQA